MKDKNDLEKLIAKKSKEPINKLLSFLILAKLNEGCSKYKLFLDKTHKDIFEDIYKDYKHDKDFLKFMVGWKSNYDELKLLIRIELYKHLDFQYVKENKSHNKIITYTLTKKGQNFLQSSLSNWFYFESGRCEIEGVIYEN